MKKRMKKLFSVLIIFLIVSMIMTGCASNTGTNQSYNAGEYTASAKGNGGNVDVKVTFTDSKIDSIEVVNETETEGLGDKALETVAASIIEKQNLAVDTVSGATHSSNAMLEAVADAVNQAGGDAEALKNAENATVKGEDEEITTDIVVVGGGASGTSAALAAAEKGAKVVVLEKGDAPGGAGRNSAEGLLAIGSKQQKEAGIDYSVDDAYKEMMEYTHYLSNARLTRAILEESASTIEWLAEYGTETTLIENTQVVHSEDPWTYHKYVDKHKSFDTMYEKLTDMGGALYTNTTGKELIKDSDGNITGIVAEKKDGSKLTVNAKSVILATGGYAGNAEMLEKYLNVTDYTTMAYPLNTGDGFKMAQSVGADEFNINAVANHAALIPSDDPEIWAGGTVSTLVQFPMLWVNREGKRFTDESVVYDFAIMANAAATQGGVFYVVLDDETLKELENQGTSMPNSFEKTFMVGAGADTTKSLNKIPPIQGLSTGMDKAIAAGVAFKADTIEELAKLMDVDANNLKKSAEAYSDAVNEGKDTEFLTNKKYLNYDINKGPFYALEANVLVEDAIGGIRVNESLQVLTPELKTINNLYAVGCDAGGLYGDSYPIFEGLTLSFAYNSGRIAGYSAVESLK